MYIIEERGESLELFDSSKSPELREATGELVIHAIGKGSLLSIWVSTLVPMTKSKKYAKGS